MFFAIIYFFFCLPTTQTKSTITCLQLLHGDLCVLHQTHRRLYNLITADNILIFPTESADLSQLSKAVVKFQFINLHTFIYKYLRQRLQSENIKNLMRAGNLVTTAAMFPGVASPWFTWQHSLSLSKQKGFIIKRIKGKHSPSKPLF